MNETRILIRLLQLYFQRNWELGPAFEKIRNFGGFEHPNPLLCRPVMKVGGQLHAPGRSTSPNDPIPIMQQTCLASQVSTSAEHLALCRDSFPGPFSSYPVGILTALSWPTLLVTCRLVREVLT
jgi:hypothetical protein